MKVLMFHYGSLENFPPILNEGKSLAEAGWEVKLFAIQYRKEQPKIQQVSEKFIIVRIKLLTRMLFGENDFFQIFRYFEVALKSFFKGIFQNTDLFIAHDLITLPYVYPLARLKHKPIVYRAHELWAEQTPDFPLAKFWKKLDRYFCKRVDEVITPDHDRALIYEKEYQAKKPPKVIYNCPRFIERPKHSPLKQLLAEHNKNSRFIVYYQGGISWDRSIDKLIYSLVFTPPEISVVLVGRINYSFEKWMKDFAEKNILNSRILYLGMIEYGNYLFDLCSGADIGVIFVKNNCRNNEFNVTATNKLFEYMMMGIPIIASDLPNYKRFIERQNIGICVNSDDPEEIARGINYLYSNPEEVNKMKLNSLSLAKEKYNWECEGSKLFEIYKSLVSKEH